MTELASCCRRYGVFVPSVDFAFIGDFKYPCQRTLNTFSCIPKYPILMKHVPGTHFLQSSPRDLFSKSLSGNMMSGTIEVRAGRAQMFQLHAVKKLGQILQVLSPPCQKYHWKKLKRLFCTLCHNSQRDNCHQMYVH